MKARFFGTSPVAPETAIVASRWYLANAGHIVLLEFVDHAGITWVGPEFPRDLAAPPYTDVKTIKRQLNVVATTVDSIQDLTDLTLEERS